MREPEHLDSSPDCVDPEQPKFGVFSMPYKNPDKQREYRARWHAKNYTGTRAEKHRQGVKARRSEARSFLANIKSSRGCGRCQERDPVCLDFHHSQGSKERELSRAVLYGWSKERMLLEVEKCEVLCANCHRKHHAGIAKR